MKATDGSPKSLLIRTVGAEWLEDQIAEHSRRQSGIRRQLHPENVRRRVPEHPLVSMKMGVDRLVEAARAEGSGMVVADANLSRLESIEADIGVLASQLDMVEAKRRLRDPADFDNYCFELHVAGAYARNRDTVRMVRPGATKSYEFGVTPRGGREEVSVECKLKEQSPWEAQANRAFGILQFRLQEVLEEKGVSGGVRVILLDIPSPELIDLLGRRVGSAIGAPLTKLEGEGFEALVETFGPEAEEVPRERVAEYYAEFADLGSSAMQVNRTKGTLSKARLVRVAIQSEEDIEKIYESFEMSVKKASRQLPKEGPGLIYLEIGRRSRGRAIRLLGMADARLPVLLSKHERVAGVVAAMTGWSDIPGGAVYTAGNRLVVNKDARRPLPEGFVVVGSPALTFGEDFMRAHPKESFRLASGW